MNQEIRQSQEVLTFRCCCPQRDRGDCGNVQRDRTREQSKHLSKLGIHIYDFEILYGEVYFDTYLCAFQMQRLRGRRFPQHLSLPSFLGVGFGRMIYLIQPPAVLVWKCGNPSSILGLDTMLWIRSLQARIFRVRMRQCELGSMRRSIQ